MRLTVCENIPADLAVQWNALVAQMGCPEVFYTHEWASAASRAFAGTSKPLLLLGYKGDTLRGVAALATDRLRQKAFFLAATTGDYCDFVSHPHSRAEFLQLVFGELQRQRLPMLVAANIPEDSATIGALRQSAAEFGYGSFSRPAYQCARVVFESAEQRQAVKQAILGDKKNRYCLKSLAKHGRVTCDHLRSWPELHAALPEFLDMHIARFRAAGRSSNLVNHDRQVFLTELTQLLSQNRSVVLSRLMVGDQPIAWNLGFQYAGSWFYYQPTFDVEWQRYSPGLCLLAKIVEAACDDPGIRLVDLGLGAEGYKMRFANRARRTLHFTITSSAVRRWREAARYNAASVIRSSPFLEHCVRRVLGRVSRGVPA